MKGSPEQVKIAIQMRDNSVSIMSFIVNDYNGVLRPVDSKNIEEEIIKTFSLRDVKPVSWKVIREEEIPVDRSYRNAWTHDGKKFLTDMDKARNIHRDKLRKEREGILIKLDSEYIRADENKDNKKKEEIIAKKQKLRDVTENVLINFAITEEELKNLTINKLIE